MRDLQRIQVGVKAQKQFLRLVLKAEFLFVGHWDQLPVPRWTQDFGMFPSDRSHQMRHADRALALGSRFIRREHQNLASAPPRLMLL
jgi:hypothetical protein